MVPMSACRVTAQKPSIVGILHEESSTGGCQLIRRAARSSAKAFSRSAAVVAQNFLRRQVDRVVRPRTGEGADVMGDDRSCW